jgi:hypothetical protein
LNATIINDIPLIKIRVAVRLIARELKHFNALRKEKRDTAPNVCYSLVLYLIWAFEKVVLVRTQAP